MLDLYIYYKVQSVHAAALWPRVQGMQQGLSARHGVVSQLRRRPVEQDGRQTWMEIYLDTPAGFDSVLQDAVSQAGIGAQIIGARHTEVFTETSPCA